MRFPLSAAGLVDTVVNTGGASAGSVYRQGFAVSSAGKLQIDVSSISADVVHVNGIACKNTGVIWAATSGGTRRVAGGLLVQDNGVLVVEEGGTPAFWVQGLPLNSDGALCVTAAS